MSPVLWMTLSAELALIPRPKKKKSHCRHVQHHSNLFWGTAWTPWAEQTSRLTEHGTGHTYQIRSVFQPKTLQYIEYSSAGPEMEA